MNNAMTTTTGSNGASLLPVRKQDPATAAMVAHAQADIQARFMIADSRPRDWERIRARSLAACSRKGFAEEAIYRKPMGGKEFIEGPSIRLAEELFRNTVNLDGTAQTVLEDDQHRVVRIAFTDLETNNRLSSDVTVEKTVLRSSAKGRTVLGERLNSSGEKVYVVACTDDELMIKELALTSKIRRNLILRMIPADIVEECMEKCRATLAGDKGDPSAAFKKLIAAFVSAGISESELVSFLGHPLDGLKRSEAHNLRGVLAAIKDGETTWKEVVAARSAQPAKTIDAKTEAAKPAGHAGEELKIDPQTGEVLGETAAGDEASDADDASGPA